MTSTARKLRWILAPLALALAASTVSGVLYGTTDAAYACHVDRGPALLHGHRAAVHTSRSHTRRQVAVHPRRTACERYRPGKSFPKGPGE